MGSERSFIRTVSKPEKADRGFNIYVVDLTKTTRVNQYELLYCRVFGRELTKKHFENLMLRLRESNVKKAYMAFHSLKMYEDGQNFIQYVKNFNHSSVRITEPLRWHNG